MQRYLSWGFVFCLVVAPLGCSKGGLKAGTVVAAKWSDSMYKGEVQSVDGDKVSVHYADGTHGTVDKTDLVVLEKNPNIQKGDSVLALWGGSKFYPGVVQEVQGDSFLVQWEDGSAPSLAKKGDIFKK